MATGIKMTTEDFVREAIKVHGNKYDYSQVEYKGAKEKVYIICPEHGGFWQRASSHLEGYDCKKCSAANRQLGMTTEEYVAKAKEIHGDKYDYSKTEYKGSLEDVCVICKDHGEFWVNASAHINKGTGCAKCAIESKRGNFEDWLKRAKLKHGDKYDYSKVDFVDMHTPVLIICPEHGEFWQRPDTHLRSGCIRCGGKWHRTREEFIEMAIAVHGDKYTYDKVEYVNSVTKVIVTCKKHGDFLITPRDLLQGQGCRECKRDKIKSKLVCGIGINDYEGFIKVDGVREPFYEMWRDMLKRCYVDCYLEDKVRSKSYKDCTVCKEWIHSKNFAEYFFDPKNGYREGYNIDKDLFAKDGKKHYSPETCCFVPPMINALISKQKQCRGAYPIGVTKRAEEQYYANVSNPLTKKQEFLGVHKTPELAFEAYKKRKKEIVNKVAEMFYSKGEITERVYNALLNFKIDITD